MTALVFNSEGYDLVHIKCCDYKNIANTCRFPFDTRNVITQTNTSTVVSGLYENLYNARRIYTYSKRRLTSQETGENVKMAGSERSSS